MKSKFLASFATLIVFLNFSISSYVLAAPEFFNRNMRPASVESKKSVERSAADSSMASRVSFAEDAIQQKSQEAPGNDFFVSKESFVEGHFFIKFRTVDPAADFSNNALGHDPFSATPELAQIARRYQIQEARKMFELILNSKNEKFREHAWVLENTFQFVSFTKDVTGLLNELGRLAEVEYVEREPRMESFYVPNDPQYAQQWHLSKINAPEAWDIYQANASNNSEVVVAIVDDAVKIDHQDLAANIWTNPAEIPNNGIDDDGNGYIDDVHGWDAADNDNNPNPPASATNFYFSHGTHVAGVVAAVSNNQIGISSIAGAGSNKVRILPVKIKKDTSSGSGLQAGIEGIQYALLSGAKIINMSWGSYSPSDTLQAILSLAADLDIVLVAAAGNSNTSYPVAYPAGYSQVIAVGATDANDVKASFSNFGDHIDVMAPGTNAYSTLPVNNNSYGALSGTSMASPLVAGLCGLISSYAPYLPAGAIRQIIQDVAADIYPLNSPDLAGCMGAGRINAQAIFEVLQDYQASSPNLDFSSNYQTVVVGHPVTFAAKVAQGSIYAYQWSFPGAISATSSSSNPVATYTAPGFYNISLTATTQGGPVSLGKAAYIHVIDESEYQNLSGKENNNWVSAEGNSLSFGGGQGLVIEAEGLSGLSDGARTAISNGDGNLLFYSYGTQLKNRHHAAMTNGSFNYTNNLMAVPQPSKFINGINQNHGKIFIFHQEGLWTDGVIFYNGALRYSIVDMNLAGGLGAVVANAKNIMISPSFTRGLAIVPHSNGHDFWVITHTLSGNNFLVYLLTENGLSETPVAGNQIGVFWPMPTMGNDNDVYTLCASSDGSRIAVKGSSQLFIYNFDNQNGLLSASPGSQSIVASDAMAFFDSSSLFSLHGKYLYFFGYCDSLQGQQAGFSRLNLSNFLIEDIGTISAVDWVADIALGPDGRIYASLSPGNLYVINNPEESIENISTQTVPCPWVSKLQNNIPFPVLKISGVIADISGQPAGGVSLQDGNMVVATTSANGEYSLTKILGWSGSITPYLSGYVFNPPLRTYSLLQNDQTFQNYTKISNASPMHSILGYVTLNGTANGVEGVLIEASNNAGFAVTGSDGQYVINNVPEGWTGTLTASYMSSGSGYNFSGPIEILTPLSADLIGQNFTATTIGVPTVTISGVVTLSSGEGLAGVTVSLSTGESTMTGSDGQYLFSYIPTGWSGTVTAGMAGYNVNAVSPLMTLPVITNQVQNFVATLNTCIISGNVNLPSGATLQGATVTLSTGQSTQTNASGFYSFLVNNGWNGTISATKTGYTITASTPLMSVPVINDQVQDFAAASTQNAFSYGMFHDIDGDGQQEPGEDMGGVVLQQFQLKDQQGQIVWSGSNLGGTVGCPVGDYYLHLIPAQGWTVTTANPVPVQIVAGQTTTIDPFGIHQIPTQQIIHLNAGWNMISFNVLPVNAGVIDIFALLVSEGKVELVKDDSGHVYWPQFGTNTVGNIQISKGYQVKANVACDLVVQGSAPTTTTIGVDNGWFIIGYPADDERPIAQVLQPLLDSGRVQIVKNGAGQTFWPQANVNSIGNMKPGQGYKIKIQDGPQGTPGATGPCALTISY